MHNLCIKSYPKLNIFLQILNRRDDGFHTIASRFVLAKGALFDTIHIQSGNAFNIEGDFGCKMPKNTIYKAIFALKEVLKKRLNETKQDSDLSLIDILAILENLHIIVEKKIPKGAGLGGGSSNAGSVINAICEYFALQLSNAEIIHIAQKSGADVAFFIYRYESANVSGIGEMVKKFDEKDMAFEIFTPTIACDTPLVYKTFDTMITQNTIQYANTTQANKLFTLKSDEILHTNKKENLNGLYIPALHAYKELAHIAQSLGNEWFFSGSGSSFFRLAQ